MKILKNARGVIEIRNSSTDELEQFFDPTGMIVTDHPRASDSICVSKTPSNQDEDESINIKLSEVTHIAGVTFAGVTRAALKEALVLLFKKGGGSGEGLQVWTRPSDWLPMPTVGANEEVWYGTYPVYENHNNLCGLRCTGNYTVDWGDGIVENFASTTLATHSYSYNGVSNPLTTRGYKVVNVKVTPQVGQTITNLSTFVQLGAYLNFYNWLDINANFSNATYNMAFCEWVENIRIKRIISTQTVTDICRFCKSLVQIKIDQFDPTNASNMFATSDPNLGIKFFEKLVRIEMPCQNIVQAENMFNGLRAMVDLSNLFFNSLSNSNTMTILRDCLCLEKYPTFSSNYAPNVINFITVVALKIYPDINLSNLTTGASFFTNRYSGVVKRSLLKGMKFTHSYSNCQLNTDALNEIFTNLGAANSGATITITGNPGSATCNQSLATAKGWTVIN